MGKEQSKTIHIGNAGEHLIGFKLSPYCIVRSVSQGRDTGIDLYCEILKRNSLALSLHFFCQVKTTKDPISPSEFENHFDYWGNQPVPVFLFHIMYKDLELMNKDHELWVYDIPYLLSINDANRELCKSTISRDVESKFKICDEDNNKDKMTLESFLYGHVSWSYGLWQMRRYGLVYPNPEVDGKDNKIFVGGFSKVYKQKIERTIDYAKMLLNKEAS